MDIVQKKRGRKPKAPEQEVVQLEQELEQIPEQEGEQIPEQIVEQVSEQIVEQVSEQIVEQEEKPKLATFADVEVVPELVPELVIEEEEVRTDAEEIIDLKKAILHHIFKNNKLIEDNEVLKIELEKCENNVVCINLEKEGDAKKHNELVDKHEQLKKEHEQLKEEHKNVCEKHDKECEEHTNLKLKIEKENQDKIDKKKKEFEMKVLLMEKRQELLELMRK